MSTVTYEGKEYRLVGQEQGECLIKCGTRVLLWYKNGKRRWSVPPIGPRIIAVERTHILEVPKRYAALVAAEKRLPPSVERAFARGTMAFAVEVE